MLGSIDICSRACSANNMYSICTHRFDCGCPDHCLANGEPKNNHLRCTWRSHMGTFMGAPRVCDEHPLGVIAPPQWFRLQAQAHTNAPKTSRADETTGQRARARDPHNSQAKPSACPLALLATIVQAVESRTGLKLDSAMPVSPTGHIAPPPKCHHSAPVCPAQG